MKSQALAPQTGRLIEAISRLECIKPFVLVGGTDAAPRKRIPSMQEIPYMNNIRLADVESIGIMKMEAMMRRSKFRDYYDIYSILKNGADIKTLIPQALEHSGHKLKSKGLMAMLSNGALFKKDEQFTQLQPIYDVSPSDIEAYIKSLLAQKD